MMVKELDVLMSEVERQIDIASKSSQQAPFGLNRSVGELILENQDRIHHLELKDWIRTLNQTNKTAWEDIVVPPNYQECLSKLLAFSNSSSPIICHEYQKTRSRDIQDIRRRDNLKHSYNTEDIWQAENLRTWVTSATSSVMIIQGTSQTIGCLEQFSYEISHQLSEIYPTIWMLSEPSSREFFAGKDETELLRQLAIQAL
ncbi:hypothetical protein F5Y12DRAFT_773864 [Xylaria sp. FL1777]|nr:hypothetical protein F5Y12DRAFT_773864 [Xylaria sp. FL1777]